MAELDSRRSETLVTTPQTSPRRRLLIPLILLAVAVFGLTAGAIRYTFEQKKAAEVAHLQAVAELKAQQIEDWLKERINDARMLQGSNSLSENYERWRGNGDLASRQRMLDRLRGFAGVYNYSGVMLLDEQGAPLWHSDKLDASIDTARRAAFLKAAESEQATQMEIYRDTSGHIHLDFVVPLRSGTGRSGSIVILHADLPDSFPPTLRTWPAATVSGEVVLLRRDGDAIVHLNKSRDVAGMALKKWLPLSNRRLLSAQVIKDPSRLGQLVEGEDAHGVAVMGVAHAIAGTDWILIVKLDCAEVYGAMHSDIFWIALAGGLSWLMIAVMLFLSRQNQMLMIAAQVQQAQDERLRALHLLASIADGSTDAIFAKDKEGRYVFFNRQSEIFTGKSMAEVLGKDDTALLSPMQAEMVMAMDREVLAHGQTRTYQYDLNIAGSIRSLLVTKGPLKDESGKCVGSFGIARDITALKGAEFRLQNTAEFISRAQGPDLFADLVRHAAQNLGLDYVHVGLLDASRQRIEILAAWLDDALIPECSYDLRNTPCTEVIKLVRQCIEGDVQALYPDDPHLKQIGAQSYVGEPLVNRAGEAIGLIVGITRLTMHEAGTVQANLRILAARAAAEWEQRQVTRALHLEARRTKALLELSSAAETMDEVTFMQHGQELAEELTGSRIAFIHWVNDDQESIERVTWSRATPEHYCQAPFDLCYPISQAGIWSEALHRREPVVFNDFAEVPDKHGLPEGNAPLERLISVPVIEGGLVRMIVAVGNKAEPYSEMDVETVKLIAETIWHIASKKRAEAALRGNEEKLRSIFRAAPTGIGVVAKRYFSEVNAALCALTGYSRDELIGQPSRMLYLNDADFEAVGREKYQQIDETGVGTVETRFRRKDGQILDVLLSSSPIDPADIARGVTFTVLDITERKQAELALQASEAQFRRLFDVTPVPLALINQAGVVVDYNRRFVQILGYTRAEVPTLAEWWQLAFPDPDYRRWAQQTWEVALNAAHAHNIDIEAVEYQVTCKDGSVRTMLISGITTEADFLATFFDVTERRQAEQALIESESMFRSLSDAAQDAIIMLNAHGEIIHWNPAATRIFGYAAAEVIGRHMHHMLPADRFRAAALAGFEKFKETGTGPAIGNTVELVGRHQDGHEIPVELSLSAIRRNDGWNAIGIVRDISSRKKAEEQLRKLAQAVEQSPESIAITNLDAEIEYVNESFVQNTGYSREEVIGQNPRVLQSGKTQLARILHKEGEIRHKYLI